MHASLKVIGALWAIALLLVIVFAFLQHKDAKDKDKAAKMHKALIGSAVALGLLSVAGAGAWFWLGKKQGAAPSQFANQLGPSSDLSDF